MDTPTRQPADLAKLKQWIEVCDPNLPLVAGDKRYFDFAANLRGFDQMSLLKDPILLGLPSSCQLFSGFRGTGKSTELQRLKRDLEQDGFVVLLIDAGDYHDLAHPIVFEDLLVILGAAFGEAVQARLGSKAPKVSFWTKVGDLASSIRIDEVGMSTPGDIAGVPLPQVDLKFGLRSDLEFWQKIRSRLKVKPLLLRQELHQHIELFADATRKAVAGCRGVVFIVDGLERISGPLTELDGFIDQTLTVFSTDPAALRLPACHAIYTLPPYVPLLNPGLSHAYRMGVALLPTIKIRDRHSGERFEPGVEALIGLLRKRIPEIEQLFVDREVLEQVIAASGGHVRNLLGLVTELLFQSRRHGLPIGAADVQQVAQFLREPMLRAISPEAAVLIERVRRTGNLVPLEQKDLKVLAGLLENFIVLCYRNGEDWYDVHPLVLNPEPTSEPGALDSEEPAPPKPKRSPRNTRPRKTGPTTS